LLGLARGTLVAHLAGRPLPPMPACAAAGLKRGAFVTITERGALRGCIGHIAADRDLGSVVRAMTVAAAQDDPRFAPVALDELPHLVVEISVLSEATRLPPPVEPTQIVVGRHGVVVRDGRHVGLLLPQVATDYQWGPEAFLAATCRKAGLAPDCWRTPSTEVFTFQADVFGETQVASREEGVG